MYGPLVLFPDKIPIMVKSLIKYFFPALICIQICKAQSNQAPDMLYGRMFHDVQMQKIFPDGKTFVDCVPKKSIKNILADYGSKKPGEANLKSFVEANFILPSPPPSLNYVQREKDISIHIKNLWGVLKKKADPQVTVPG